MARKTSAVGAGDYGRIGQYNDLRDEAYASSMLQARAQTVPDLTVYVNPGVVYINGVKIVFAGGNSPSFTAPSTNPRIDLLSINSSGTLVRTAGVEAGSPTAPTLPFASVAIAQIYNRVSQTQIYDTDQGAGKGYIYADTRMFLSEIDLINDANADGTPANNAGRVGILESDGKLSRQFIHQNQKSALLAGENITGATTPQACFIMSEQRINRREVLTVHKSDAEADFEMYKDGGGNDRRFGININSGTFNFITGFTWYGNREGNISSHNYIMELFAVDGSGFPTGAALASKAFTDANWYNPNNGVEHWFIEFTSPVAVSTSTDYIITIRETSSTGSSSLNIHCYTHSTGGNMKYATTGSNWANGSPSGSNYSVAACVVYGYVTKTVGRVYLSDADDPDRNYFDGFVYQTVTAGNSCNLLWGTDIPFFSGLLPGTDYFLDTSQGAITATPTRGKKVGTAKSTTTIAPNDKMVLSNVYDQDFGGEDRAYADCLMNVVIIQEVQLELVISDLLHDIMFGNDDKTTIVEAGSSTSSDVINMSQYVKQKEYVGINVDRGSNTWSFVNDYDYLRMRYHL